MSLCVRVCVRVCVHVSLRMCGYACGVFNVTVSFFLCSRVQGVVGGGRVP